MSEPSLTSEAVLREAAARIDSETSRLDAELLLSHVTGWSRTSFRTWPEREVPADPLARFQALLVRRVAGEPIAHLLGEQDFWSLTLAVTPDTLIPRPDTECLVEVALELPLPAEARVMDLGTGTGAIALALAKERPQWRVSACDAVPDAVALARHNAQRLGLPVQVEASHWFDDLPAQRFDLIVSNPPYIAADDRHLAEGDVRFEPATALVSGADGLDDLRQIVTQAPDWLDEGGWLLVEHGYDQATAVQALFRQAGFWAVQSRQDYGGQDRLTLGQFHRRERRDASC
ncbi:MAG: peptide chain release factor N(5)-glutamine methyltransferase [Marinobacter sp.]|uniref:peptide chain release factor N(5)-glutamine methyltransferase n=1 Tax=Marinobacter sp. TaxID=50741 RepID=UPI00299E7E8D|nr:peptide chain release factor N(5)-glutamine methyltransferase [Marinobacter sp.]MDX1755905.1 peptide chain release factor N(5)-glutamine methyltransferase [Marinobacter sp.]